MTKRVVPAVVVLAAGLGLAIAPEVAAAPPQCVEISQLTRQCVTTGGSNAIITSAPSVDATFGFPYFYAPGWGPNDFGGYTPGWATNNNSNWQ